MRIILNRRVTRGATVYYPHETVDVYAPFAMLWVEKGWAEKPKRQKSNKASTSEADVKADEDAGE